MKRYQCTFSFTLSFKEKIDKDHLDAEVIFYANRDSADFEWVWANIA